MEEMQNKLAKMQEDLAKTTVEASAGGGAVAVVIDGQQRVQTIKISPEAIDPEDPGLLEDLIIAAVNEAIKKSQELAQKQMDKITGGIKIPGLM
jgi:hypothetical protein